MAGEYCYMDQKAGEHFVDRTEVVCATEVVVAEGTELDQMEAKAAVCRGYSGWTERTRRAARQPQTPV